MAMKVDAGTPGWQQRHIELYRKTDGAEGHLVDFGRPGMSEVPTLLLETIGRKSHTAQTTPLMTAAVSATKTDRSKAEKTRI